MSDHEEEELDGVVAPGAARRKASKTALRRSALVDSDDNDDDDDDDENLFADSDDDDDDDDENDKGTGTDKKENNKKTFADDDNDSAATSQGWEKYKNALENLREFIVEQRDIDGDSSSSQGQLQPFDLDANVELLEEQGLGSDLQAIDDAISKIANSRKWSFHKDLLLEYLTKKGDIMSLESRMLVGIIARQILVRSKSENPPNKAVAQELFVKLKGDSDKSNSIALYVTSKWPKHFFEEVETNIPSQPDKDLRIHIIKVGLGFVRNAFVIDTAKKVDLLKSRNLLWADFSQQAYQWAFENKTNGTSRIMEVAENAKNHLQTIGASFSGIETSTSTMSDNKSNAKEDHVLKDEEELKRIEAQKSEERRAAMRSKMRRGSNIANAPIPATAMPSSGGVSASVGAPTIPNRPSIATTPASGISYQKMITNGQGYSSGSQHATHPSFPGHTAPPTATSGVLDPNSGGFAQEYNASSYQETSAPFAAPVAHNGQADYKAAGTSRWGNNRRQDQNRDPQNQAPRYSRDERLEARPPIREDVSRPFSSGRGQSTLSEVPLMKPFFDEHRTQRPPLRDDEPRNMMSTPKVPQPRRGMEELRSQRPSLHDANGGVFVADVSQESASRVYQARPGHEERVALRPPLNENEGRPRSFVDDSNYSAYDAVTNSREYNSVSGYENRYEQEEFGRPPREPSRYTDPNQSSSYPSQGTGNKRSRGGGSYQRNTRQRSDSPSFGDGRGRGRGLDMTKPAWMTDPSGPVGGPDGNNFHSSGSSNGAALVDSSASGGGGRGRGRHQTAPAWMTRNQQDQTSMGIGPLPPSGGGRGIHQTQPAWMTQQQQQQQQGGPTGRPEGPIGSSDGGAGRGRGRGLTLPAWVTQQQQQ